MKNLLTTIFFVITLFSISGASASAYYYSDIGTYTNPVYIQNADPFADMIQQRQQRDLLDALNKQTQAIDNAAFQAQQRQNAQWRAAQDAQMNQYWGSGSFGSSNVVPVSVNKDTTTLRDWHDSLDSSCRKTFGGNSLFDASNKSGCGCKKGYSWNSAATACVDESAIPVKTNDQICRESYGVNSNWNTINDEGGHVQVSISDPLKKEITCGCVSGYKWNGSLFNACVVIPKKVAETPKVKTTVQAQGVTPASHTQEASVAGTLPDTQTVKTKGLWATIRGWFGF